MIRILAVVAGSLFWWSGLAQAIPITGVEHNDNVNVNGLTGLDRANEVAGEHGQHGRDIAALHQANISLQNGTFTTQLGGPTPSTIPTAAMNSQTTVTGAQNGSLTTQAVGLTSSTTNPGAATSGQTTIPNSNTQNVPEPTSLWLLGSGLIGLWFSKGRKS